MCDYILHVETHNAKGFERIDRDKIKDDIYLMHIYFNIRRKMGKSLENWEKV